MESESALNQSVSFVESLLKLFQVFVLLLYPESCKPFDFCHLIELIFLELLNILLLRDCDSLCMHPLK